MNTGLNVNMIGSIEHRLETSGKLADRAENGRAETEKGMLDFSDVHSVEKKMNPLARGGSIFLCPVSRLRYQDAFLSSQ